MNQISDGYLYKSDSGIFYVHREEASWEWEPLKRVQTDSVLQQKGVNETWENSRYCVTVRRFSNGFFIKNCAYAILGIMNEDNTARHDWRDFQQIKNQLCGKDWEGIELYPAETRLIDPSNEFFMWCVPKGVLKFGIGRGRRVLDADKAIAPQRPFPKQG